MVYFYYRNNVMKSLIIVNNRVPSILSFLERIMCEVMKRVMKRIHISLDNSWCNFSYALSLHYETETLFVKL